MAGTSGRNKPSYGQELKMATREEVIAGTCDCGCGCEAGCDCAPPCDCNCND
jgi:hypothetical protein